MRSKILIRCGIAALLVGGSAGGMLASGCGGDDNGSPKTNGDSGADTSVPGDDGGPGNTDDSGNPKPHPDSGTDGGGGDAGDGGTTGPANGKLIVVHGSANAQALRFCLGIVKTTDAGTSIKMAPTNPLPNTAGGVLPGTGGPAGDLGPLTTQSLALYGINASALTSVVQTDAGKELTCPQIIGADAVDAGLNLMEGRDYWNLGTLPAGTIAPATTTLVVVTGCAPHNDTNAVDVCPAAPDGAPYVSANGNLGLWVTKLDTMTAIDGGAIGAQFAHASYPFQTYTAIVQSPLTVAGFTQTTLVTPEAGPPPDAGTTDAGDAAPADSGATTTDATVAPVPVTDTKTIALGISYGQLAPTALKSVPGLTLDSFSGAFFAALNDAGAPTPLVVPVPFPGIQALSEPTVTTKEFVNGTGYVFILVGDPRLPSYLGADGGPTTPDAGNFNLYSAHILGFPTNP